MMKIFIKLICFITIPFVLVCCSDNKSTSTNESLASTRKLDVLKVGGLYILINEDGTYSIAKILVLDDFAVHLRTYSDTFKTKPKDISTESLRILIGHAPLDKNAFLINKPELLKVEEVKESELEGYKVYLESMNE